MPSTSNAAIVEISKTANQFASSIVLHYENKFIDVKSILGLFTTMLNTGTYDLHIHGPDASEAKKTMKEVFEKHGVVVNLVD